MSGRKIFRPDGVIEGESMKTLETISDPVELVRVVREMIYEETKNMTYDEAKEYRRKFDVEFYASSPKSKSNPKPTDPVARKKWVQDELQRIRAEQGQKNYDAVFGKWPSNETDEEIETLLKEVS
jgi:hypothetical protein